MHKQHSSRQFQSCPAEVGFEQTLLAGLGRQGLVNVAPHRCGVAGRDVRQSAPLGGAPDMLYRVELGSVGRQPIEASPSTADLSQEVLRFAVGANVLSALVRVPKGDSALGRISSQTSVHWRTAELESR